jgi:hypothetical protein
MDKALLETALQDAWMKQYGSPLQTGSFKLDSETMQEFNDQFEDVESAALFIQDSVRVWHARMKHLKHPPPFYANKVLFAEKQLDVLSRYRDKSRMGTHETFIRGECLRMEVDYLTLHLALNGSESKPTIWALLSPNPYWIVASQYFQRISKCPFKDQKVLYKGKLWSLWRALGDLIQVLKQSKVTRDAFLSTAQAAFEQARQQFLVLTGHASVAPGRLHEMKFESKISAVFSIPLKDSDIVLFDAIARENAETTQNGHTT